MKEPLTKIEQEEVLVWDKDGKFSLGLKGLSAGQGGGERLQRSERTVHGAGKQRQGKQGKEREGTDADQTCDPDSAVGTRGRGGEQEGGEKVRRERWS